MASGQFLILVDSSVWIDFFKGSSSSEVIEFAGLIASDQSAATTSLVVTEVLRGCSSEREARTVASEMVTLPFLELDGPNDHIEAARLYRQARAAGITVRNTIDLLIATTCIRYEAWLLHSDRDFDQLATCSDLKIWKPET